MKKILSLILCAALLLSCCPIIPLQAAAATSGTCGENLTWTLDDEGTLTISGTGAMSDFESSTSAPWYTYRTSIKKVIIESGVTSIGDYAFYECTNLADVTIPDTVTSIAWHVFRYCSSLTGITIPGSVTSIGGYAFEYCTGLTTLTIPDSVTSIGNAAFGSCSQLKTVTIGAGVTSIGNSSFRLCPKLKDMYYEGAQAQWEQISFGENGYLDSLTLHTINGVAVKTQPVKTVYRVNESLDATGLVLTVSYTNGGEKEITEGYTISGFDSATAGTKTVTVTYMGCETSFEVRVLDTTNAVACGDNLFFILEGKTGYICGTGPMWDYPTQENGSSEKGPWDDFTWNEECKSIVIEEGVTSIGDRAFSEPGYLFNVSISNTVTSIGDYAFDACIDLTTIDIPDSVTTIGTGAFSYCRSLTSITIPDSVTSIGESAFQSCTSLTSITIPDSVTTIGDGAFEDCTSLTSITIPDSVTSIGEWAFEGCTSLTSITIPDSVTTIDFGAFQSCTSLTSITIPDSVTTIDWCAFNRCDSLTDVYYNGTQAQWEQIAVGGDNENLTNATLHTVESTTVIASGTCGENLTWTLDDEGTLTISGTGAMSDFESSTSAPWYTYRTSIKKVIIESGVTSIGDHAFANCYDLNVVTMGNSVTTIGEYAFCSCGSLTSITIPDSMTTIGDHAFADCYNLNVVTIGDNVTTIGEYAFYFCDSLTSITIPDSVTTIGEGAFRFCDSLTTVTMGNSVTSIGDLAFADCYNLNVVTIGDNVTTIGEYAFSFCHSLTNVYYKGTGAQWRRISIGNSNEYLTNAIIHAADAIIVAHGACGAYGFDLTWTLDNTGTLTISGDGQMMSCENRSDIPWYNHQDNIKKVIINDGVTRIGMNAFANCTNLTEVSIPDSVTEILRHAFYCSGLTEITLPKNITTIGYQAFAQCTNLTAATIPDSVTSVGSGAFAYCSNLTMATLPNSITAISVSMFYSCRRLVTCIIPHGITAIQDNAFYGCKSLESITLPVSVSVIASNAFTSCSKLTDVYYAGTTERWSQLCSDSGYQVLPNANIHCNHIHDYSLFPPVEVAPTCTEIGYTEYTCIYGETYRLEYVPSLGHECTVLLNTVAPTCETYGYTGIKCTRCDHVEETDIVPALGHECTIVVNTAAPTCEADGYTNKKCTRCDHVEKADIKYALGHKMAILPAVAPTCTETGLSIGTACIRCGMVGVTQTVVPATGHNYVDGMCTVCSIETISIKVAPFKQYYNLGDDLELSGLILLATQKNGVTKDVTEGYTVSGFDSATTGKKTVTVTYEGCSTSFDVFVVGESDKIIDTDGICFETLTEAIQEAVNGDKLTFVKNIIENVTVDKTVNIDLNGFSITGTLTVKDGSILYGMDVQTDDYTVRDGKGYGKISKVVLEGSGKLMGLPADSDLAEDGYMMITEADGISFHRVNLQLKSMSLRAADSGIYFKSDFAGDELVAENVKQFGVALSVQGTPDATNMDSQCKYSKFTGFAAGKNADTTSTLLKGVMKSGNAALVNHRNANMPIYGRAYILTNDGEYIFGTAASRTFKQQVEAIDTMWSKLSATQRSSLADMYTEFARVMGSWNIPNLKAYFN